MNAQYEIRASRQTEKHRDSEIRPRRDTEERQRRDRWDTEESPRDSEAEKLRDTKTHWEESKKKKRETETEKDRTYIQESKRIIIYLALGNETLWRLAGKEKELTKREEGDRRLMRLMKHHLRKGGQEGFKKQHEKKIHNDV